MNLETIKGFRNDANPDYTNTINHIKDRYEGGQQFAAKPAQKPAYKAPTL